MRPRPPNRALLLVMASRLFSVDEVVANIQDLMAIPGPCEDDEWSDDDFNGYVESDVDDTAAVGEDIDMRDNESVQVPSLLSVEPGIPTYTIQIMRNLYAIFLHS